MRAPHARRLQTTDRFENLLLKSSEFRLKNETVTAYNAAVAVLVAMTQTTHQPELPMLSILDHRKDE